MSLRLKYTATNKNGCSLNSYYFLQHLHGWNAGRRGGWGFGWMDGWDEGRADGRMQDTEMISFPAILNWC